MPEPKSFLLTADLHRYLVDHTTPLDEVQRDLIAERAALGGISQMQVAPEQGALLTDRAWWVLKSVRSSPVTSASTCLGDSAVRRRRVVLPDRLGIDLADNALDLLGGKVEVTSRDPRSGHSRCPLCWVLFAAYLSWTVLAYDRSITMQDDDAMVRHPVRTTVNIDDHLLVEAKQVAARTGRSLGDIVDDALRVLLARGDEKPRSRVVLPTDGGSGLRPGVDLDDKEAMAELLGDNLPPGHSGRDDSWQLDAPG